MTHHCDCSDEPHDSLALLGEQDRILVELFADWHRTSPDSDDPATEVPQAFDHGTLGKLLIEHTAIRLAAKADIARVLRKVGHHHVADSFAGHLPQARALLDRLDEQSRGVAAVGVGGSTAFAGTVGQLVALIRADLNREPDTELPRIAALLGPDRADLHSAKHVTRHAPTHPAPNPRWYGRIPALVAIHARYDHLRGFPWANDAPDANAAIAARYDQHQ